MQDMIAKGRNVILKGVDHGMAVLNESEVLSIFNDNRLQKVIALEYKIDPSTVSDIKRKKSWKHLHKMDAKK